MDAGHLGKNRNPVAVWLLSMVTFGIYWLVYYYKINDEMRQHDPNIEVKPGIAVLAQFVPLANLISLYNTAARIQKMETDDGVTAPLSPIVAFLLFFVCGVGIFPMQAHLNAHWDRHRETATQAAPSPA